MHIVRRYDIIYQLPTRERQNLFALLCVRNQARLLERGSTSKKSMGLQNTSSKSIYWWSRPPRWHNEGHHLTSNWLASSVHTIPLLGRDEDSLIVIFRNCHIGRTVTSSRVQYQQQPVRGGTNQQTQHKILCASPKKHSSCEVVMVQLYVHHPSYLIYYCSALVGGCMLSYPFIFLFFSLQCGVHSGMRLGIDYPELVVFDLDACLWDQETFELNALPNRTELGDLNGTFPHMLLCVNGFLSLVRVVMPLLHDIRRSKPHCMLSDRCFVDSQYFLQHTTTPQCILWLV